MRLAFRLPVLALFTRALRREARSPWAYLLRAGLLVILFVALLISAKESLRTGAPGLGLFGAFAVLNLVGIFLLGCSYFATVITEEREELALGLLRMTSLNSVAILLGKTGGRLLTVLFLLAMQIPIVFLSVALGGVAPAQVLATAVNIAAWVLFCAGLGLLASAIFQRSFAACAVATGILSFVLLAPTLFHELIADSFRGTRMPEFVQSMDSALRSIRFLNPFERVFSQFRVGASGSAFTWQIWVRVAIAAALALAAWGVFQSGRRDEISVRGPRAPSRWRLFSRPRPGPRRNPIAWKDFHFVAGGRVFLWLRLLAYLLVVACSAWVVWSSGWGARWSPAARSTPWFGPARLWSEFGEILMGWGLPAFWLESSVLAGRVFRVEVRRQTWSSLLSLPLGLGRVVVSKLAACAATLLPALLVAAGGFACVFISNSHLHPTIVWRVEVILAVVAAFLYFLVHPILVAYCSLRVRWGAIALASGIEVFLLVVVGMICEGALPRSVDEDVVACTIFLTILIVTATSLTFAIRNRLRILAAQ